MKIVMNAKYAIGDHVFVVDWDQRYDKHFSSMKVPMYSGPDFFWKIEYEPQAELTKKGTPYKRRPDRKVKSRTPVWQNFKYTIMDVSYHPKAGELMYPDNPQWGTDRYSSEPIYLLSSKEGCWVSIEEKGISLMTPEQYAMTQFDALKEMNKGKWIPGLDRREYEKFPKELARIVYDRNDNVLFGSRMVKGKVEYGYIPGEYMSTGRDYIHSVSISYDGKGNSDIPENSELMHYNELAKRFVDNTFH